MKAFCYTKDMEDRAILHCDCNNFFAACECLENPKIRNKPVVVAGKVEERRGVIVAKNYIAKAAGVQTGMKIFEAMALCPDLVVVNPHMNLYNEYSKKVRDIFIRYTDRVESFSIDECFLDVTHSKMFGTPQEIADKIRRDVREEIGLTVSVGVSFCKVFAKIGSDLKKPDATTIISKDNYKEVVWPLSIGDMIGVGRHTREKMLMWGIKTIGDLAKFPCDLIVKKLGKVGKDLWNHSNGIDDREVALYYHKEQPKSIGNSATFYRDLRTRDEVLMALSVLAESVSSRMIKHGMRTAKTIHLVVKNNDLSYFGKQCALPFPCRDSKIFAHTAYNMFVKHYDFRANVRLLGVSVSGFEDDGSQMSMFDTQAASNIDETLTAIRSKYGYAAIGRASRLLDRKIAGVMDRAEIFKEIKDFNEDIEKA